MTVAGVWDRLADGFVPMAELTSVLRFSMKWQLTPRDTLLYPPILLFIHPPIIYSSKHSTNIVGGTRHMSAQSWTPRQTETSQPP